MPRSGRLAALLTLGAALAAGPMTSGSAYAADPIVVQPGDTLTGIAKRHGLTIAQLVELNDLADPNRIVAGQRLTVSSSPGARPAAPRPATPSAPAARSHTVRSGEHLTGIARHYGLTIAEVAAANGISDPSRIYAGQRLRIPGAPASPAPSASARQPGAAPAERSHTVRSGEHLTGIARHYGLTIAEVAAANGISDPSRIYAGQRLHIPGAVASSPADAGTSLPAEVRDRMEGRSDARRLIAAEAERFGVPVPLALAVAWQESGWQQRVVSTAGAIGIMQLLPSTGEWVGEAMLGTRVDLRDARQNVRAGTRLLAHYLDRYEGNVDLVLAAYYQGQTATDRHGVYPVSRPYLASIKALVRMLGG
ncbi:MAG TPA: LysM peptidoglycan-binding domain-containing protein [Candidatus Angelobacter sp.]|nr:LysM peptidoglycan-binding domain-containing protein [Candidatus Angelobacter sp.]